MSKNIVVVTHHACEQFKERFPDHEGKASIRLFIASEVEEALKDYRYSTKQPAWARNNGHRSRGRRNKHELDRSLRFVWTEDQQRMYLIDKRGNVIKVITSIKPEGIDDEA